MMLVIIYLCFAYNPICDHLINPVYIRRQSFSKFRNRRFTPLNPDQDKEAIPIRLEAIAIDQTTRSRVPVRVRVLLVSGTTPLRRGPRAEGEIGPKAVKKHGLLCLVASLLLVAMPGAPS